MTAWLAADALNSWFATSASAALESFVGLHMDYLVYKLAWWLLGAFGIGVCVGWLSCGRPRDADGGPPA